MTDQPNATQKVAHLAPGGAISQEAHPRRAVALCETILLGVEEFEEVPADFELCPTCAERHAGRLDKSSKFGVSVVTGETRERARGGKCSRHGFQRFFDCAECFALQVEGKSEPAALEVGATELEDAGAAAPPPDFAPLGVTLYTPGEPPKTLLFEHAKKRIFVVGVDEGAEGGDRSAVVMLRREANPDAGAPTVLRVVSVKESPDNAATESEEA